MRRAVPLKHFSILSFLALAVRSRLCQLLREYSIQSRSDNWNVCNYHRSSVRLPVFLTKIEAFQLTARSSIDPLEDCGFTSSPRVITCTNRDYNEDHKRRLVRTSSQLRSGT